MSRDDREPTRTPGSGVVREAVRRARASRRSVLIATLCVAAEAAAVLFHLRTARVIVTDPLILVYPFVWINLGIWAAVRVDRPAAAPTRLAAAGLVAGAYFLLLSAAGGVVGVGHAVHGQAAAVGGSVRLVTGSMPPGWGPAVFYDGGVVRLSVLPFKLTGYLSLSYLVLVSLLELDVTLLSRVFGLATCVSCTWPVVGALITAALGGGSPAAAAAMNYPYGLSTVVFVTAVGLLVRRPFTGSATVAWLRRRS